MDNSAPGIDYSGVTFVDEDPQEDTPMGAMPAAAPAAAAPAAPAAPAASSGAAAPAAPAAPAVPAWGLEHLGENCPICLEELGTTGDVVQLQCPQPLGAGESAPHLFHLQCIAQYVQSSGKRGFPGTPGTQAPCPTCKAPMTHCRSVRTGKLQVLTAETEAGTSAAPVTSRDDRALLRQLQQLQQDLPPAPPGSARAEGRFSYYEGPQPRSRSSSARRGRSATTASTTTASTRATNAPVTADATPTDAVDGAAAPASAATAPASTDAAAAARGSPRPAEPATTPMDTDEPHAAPPPAAAAFAAGGAALVSGAAAACNEICPICTEDRPKSQVVTLACGHRTCGGCMLKMRSAYTEQPNRIDLTYDPGAASDGTLAPPRCPMCRRPIREAEFAAAEAIVAAVPAPPTLESAGKPARGGGEQEEDGGAPEHGGGAEPATGDDGELHRAIEEEWASTHESVEDQVRRQFPTPEELAAGLGVSMQVEDAAAPGATPVAEP